MPFFSLFRRENFRKLFRTAAETEKHSPAPEPEKPQFLVAGLGNPGPEYEKTRHNIGFMVAEHLATRWGIRFELLESDARLAIGRFENISVAIAKPQSFMNLSGPPVFGLASRYGINRDNILVIHDDLDLPFGKIKIKAKGGHGGHKGIQSLMKSFEDGNFPRLRIGIGRPTGAEKVVDHVLGRFDSTEEVVLGSLVELAGDAVEMILLEGCQKGMNLFNNQQITA